MSQMSSDRWSIFCCTFMVANGTLVRVLIHTNVTKYLNFKAVDGSFVYNKGKIYKVPATDVEALTSSVMGLFEKRCARNFFLFVQQFEEIDPGTHQGLDVKNITVKELTAKYELEDDTVDFIGHALALYRDENYLNQPAFDFMKRMKLYAESLARFQAGSPYIYPMYGLGELPQAFARLSVIMECKMFTGNGELVLYDSGSRKIAWASHTSNTSVTSAMLRDDGNLVLINKNQNVVWQSFDTPCDTLLPGQNLSVPMTLRPYKSDSLSSYYTLYMNMSGELQLRWETSVIYWSKGKPSHSRSYAMLSSNGIFEVLDQTSRSVWSAYGADHGDTDVVFRFSRIDSDGNLRLYSWSEASKSWKTA